MIEEKWLNQRVGTVYAYWEDLVPASQLEATCIERVMLMIAQYRENEDPEQYREYIEQRVRLLIATNNG